MDRRFLPHVRCVCLGLVVAAAAAWFSAGCTGQSTPTGGTATPVAVELPAAFDQTTFDEGTLH